MAHSSQNQNPLHQPATAGFQPESLGLQSPFDGHSFNSMPANGMASRSAGAPATLNISAQADSTQIDVGFAGDNQDGQKPFSMKLDGLGLGNPTEWAQGLKQVGNAVSSWLQRVSGEIVGAEASIEHPGAGLPKLSDVEGAGAPKTLVGIIDTGFGANDHGRKILDTIQTGDNDTSVWLGGGVGAGTWADSLNEFVDVAKASGNPRAVANLSFDLSQVNPDGSVSTRYQLTPKEQSALANAAANDVLVVAASGNQGEVMSALGLASQQHDNVIAVGAAEGNDRAAYSSYGPGLDFLAEGTGPGGQGTSIAAANLTETITDVWAADPTLSSGQVVQMLKDTATDLHQPGPDIKTGHGVVNRDRAVEQASGGVEADQSVFDLQQEQLGSHLSLDSFNSQNKIFPDSTLASERPALSDKEIARAMDGAVSKLNALNRMPVPPEEDDYYPDIQDEARKIKALRDPLYFDQVFRYEQGVSPKESSLVRKWQEKINDSGVLGYSITTDGKFGRESAKAALQFQKKNGLPADGILGPETWKATFSTSQETSSLGNSSREKLRYGDGIQTSDDDLKNRVKEWQKFLNGQGVSRRLTEDGQFGGNTKEMTIEFQQKSNIGDDGIVGAQTWGAAEKRGFSLSSGESNTTSTIGSVPGFASRDVKGSDGNTHSIEIQRYGPNGALLRDFDPNKETVVVVHGRASSIEDDSLQALAKQAAKNNPNLQVLTLDWTSLAKPSRWKPLEFKPIAQNISPVARAAKDELSKIGIDPKKLTLVGHSFGSYVSSEIASEFGKVKNLVALDPAAGSFVWKDIDHEKPGNQKPKPFREVASNSLALVVRDEGFGDSGDNKRAATAHRSLLVDYQSYPRGPENFKTGHSAVVDVFTASLNQKDSGGRSLLSLPNLRLPPHQSNRFAHSGERTEGIIYDHPDDPPNPYSEVPSSHGHHEGIIVVKPNKQDWSSGNPRHIEELQIVDTSGRLTRTWNS